MTAPAPVAEETPVDQPKGRSRLARTEVAIVMAAVSIVSILIMGVFNLATARSFLIAAVERQLVSVGESRMDQLARGVDAIGDLVVSIAQGTGAAEALRDLDDGYRAIDEPLSDTQIEELRSAYEAALVRIVPPGYEPPQLDEVFPDSTAAQYLQYHYLLANPFPAGERSSLDDAGDGSLYSEAHAMHHPFLRSVASALGLGDMLLIDAETSTVVYTVDKRSDLGTSLVSGPYRDSALAKAVIDGLETAGADEAVLVDFEAFAPAGFAPTAFMAAAIQDEGRVTGAVAVEIPNELLVNLTTAGRDWEGTGLGETGEVYIVGADGLMRTDSRLWLEDPDRYLELVGAADYAPEVAKAAEAFGTTVLIQPVNTDAVEATLTGATFVGSSANYLDQGTLTVAAPLDIKGLQWVGVAEVSTSEAFDRLERHTITLLILLVILVPVVIAAAMVLARRNLRPIGPIIDAADAVRAGDLDVVLDVHTKDEFGDLAAKFNGVVSTLRQQATDLKRAEAETTDLLRAVMPSRLVQQYLEGDRDISEALGNATLVAIFVDEPDVVQAADREAIADHTVAVAAGLETLANRHGLEQVVSSATEYLAVAGLDVEQDEAAKAVAFAVDVREWLGEAGSSAGVEIATRIGLASGDVVSGVVGTERVTFNVWGNPRRRAEALAAVAGRGEILVDPTVASRVGEAWAVDPVLGLVGVDGATVEGWRVVGLRRDIG